MESIERVLPHNLYLSRIDESARTLVVLDVDALKARFNVKNTHIPMSFYALILNEELGRIGYVEFVSL